VKSRRQRMTEATRGIAFRQLSAIDKITPIIVVFTGFGGSSNLKTGDMVQSWIMLEHVEPVTAWQTHEDYAVCGNCSLRHGASDVRCYVNKGHAPLAVHRAYHRGKYLVVEQDISWEEAIQRINMAPNRGGSYGDPLAAPYIFSRLRPVTSYTHQWDQPVVGELIEDGIDVRQHNMASVDTIYQKRKANQLGWRTYRIVKEDESLDIDEIMCPWNPDEPRKVQCVSCGLCGGKEVRAPNIAVRPLGREHH